jgi:uncharacterized membrane protein YphA (DoxX/SURF4 family)
MTFSQSKTWRRVALVLRLALGVIFVYAAWLKLHDSWRIFAMDIDAYKILPSIFWVEVVARSLPWLELLLGFWLMSGLWLRGSATITALLLTGFFGLMIWAQIKGLQINCGCFGPGERISWITMLRDGSLLAAALALAAWSYLSRQTAPSAEPAQAAV